MSLIAYVLFCSLTVCFLKKWAPLKYITNFTLTFSLFLIPNITNNGFHNYELKQGLYASKLIIFKNLHLLHTLSRPFVSVGAISESTGTLSCYTAFINDTTQTLHKRGEVNKHNSYIKRALFENLNPIGSGKQKHPVSSILQQMSMVLVAGAQLFSMSLSA